MDDGANFIQLCNCLLSVGVSAAEQDIIFRVISSILSLGNIDFHGVDSVAEGEVAAIDEPYTVSIAAELLGVKAASLENVLLSRQLTVASELELNPGTEAKKGTDQYSIKRDVVQANYARDSMAKSIYQVGAFTLLAFCFNICLIRVIVACLSIRWANYL